MNTHPSRAKKQYADEAGDSDDEPMRLSPAAAAAAAAAGGGQDDDDDDADEVSSTDDEEDEPPPKKSKKAAAPKKQSKAKAPAKAKAPKKAKAAKKGPRMGAKKAIKIYELDAADLAQMKDVKFQGNAWFGFNRMYSPIELEEYARKKHAGREGFLRSMQSGLSAQEERRERKRGYRAIESAAAAAVITKYATKSDALEVEQYGDTKLPDEVLLRVMTSLANTREPGGLRGFAEVAQDLANASLANWDFHRASKAGFTALGEEAATTPYPPKPAGPTPRIAMYSWLQSSDLESLPGPIEGGWAFWEGFLKDPLKYKVAVMEQAMRIVRLKPKGTKAENAQRLLGAFRLKAATSVPVQLLRVVVLERSKRIAWDGPTPAVVRARVDTAITQLVAADKEAWKGLSQAKDRGVAYIRAAIRAHFDSIDDMVAAAAAADEERQRKQVEAAGGDPAAATPAAAVNPPPAAPSAAAAGFDLMALLMGVGGDAGMLDYDDGF